MKGVMSEISSLPKVWPAKSRICLSVLYATVLNCSSAFSALKTQVNCSVRLGNTDSRAVPKRFRIEPISWRVAA